MKGAGEMAGAHVGARGHRLDGVILGDVLEEEAQGLAQRLALGLLGGERGAELRLVAGTAQEQHEVTGDRKRGRAVEVVLDEREREVHPGGYPGGGPELPVADVDRLGVDVHRGMRTRELGGGGPVGGRTAAVEQPRGSQQEGACANGGGAPGGSGALGDPVEEHAVGHRLDVATPAGDEQRVNRQPRLAQRAIGSDPQAARGAQRHAFSTEDLDLVAAPAVSALAASRLEQLLRAGEHLEGTRDVEALHARVGDDHDPTRRGGYVHGAIIAHQVTVRKDRFPTISAIGLAARVLADEHPCARREARKGWGERGQAQRFTMPPVEDDPQGSRFAEEADPDALEAAPGRVASIVGAAERAAAELREQAETRTRERIAEAERAADNHVLAAEEEAEDILHAARSEAEATSNQAIAAATALHTEAERVRDEAARILAEAREEATRLLSDSREESARLRTEAGEESARWRAEAKEDGEQVRAEADEESEQVRATAEEESQELLEKSREEAKQIADETREQTERLLLARREELARLHTEAEEQAKEIRAQARVEARDITSEAHAVAHDVLSEGTEVSRNLRELSVSLHNNAERLIRDVRLAHGGMTARLDQVGPGEPEKTAPGQEPERGAKREASTRQKGRRRRADDGPSDDLDVPEFMPRG
jgi:cell division septum initiation protein DivIVA